MKNRLLKDKRGDFNYIDTVIGMFIMMILVLLVLNIYSYLMLKQNLDYICDSLVESVAVEGEVGTGTEARFESLCAEVGLDSSKMSYSFEGSDFDSGTSVIQYGKLISVSVTCPGELAGTGIFEIPVSVTAKASGLSEKFRK